MEKMLKYFYRVRQKHPHLTKDIQAILSEHKCPQEGITIAELKDAYFKRTYKKFPLGCGPIAVMEFVLTIPYISIYCNSKGTLYFYSINH